VFLGYGELGATVLAGIAPHHDVLAVVTHPRSFGGLHEPDVERLAGELGLDVRFSERAGEPELHEHLRELEPQVIVSTNWRTRLPKAVLSIPAAGAVNVHDALLPAYSGFGAVNWAIRDGRDTTGVTVHFMDEELDTGPVLTRAVVRIGPREQAGQVLAKVVAEYVPSTLRALDLVAQGHRGEPQDPRGASFYHRIGVPDTRIDWNASGSEIHDLVRGQADPFVNAWTTHHGRRLWVKAAAPPDRCYGGTPGRIVRHAEAGVAIASGRRDHGQDRGIVLLEVAPDEGLPVRAVDYFGPGGGYLR
jgi:methionyl-tRNA formyltransferase